MPTATIIKLDLDNPAALFHRYPSEPDPQPVNLVIDLRDGTVFCDWKNEPGRTCMPASVFHGRVRWYRIPVLTAAAANRLLDDALPYAQRILTGSHIDFDGSNHVGYLNDDAASAEVALTDMIERRYPDDAASPDAVTEWQAADFFSGSDDDDACDEYNITAETSDEQLTAITGTVEQQMRATADGVIAPTGVTDYLTELRDKQRTHARDALDNTRIQLEQLLATRNKLIRNIYSWGAGDTHRSIAELAGLTHPQVGSIIRTAGHPAEGDIIERLNTYTGDNIWQDIIAGFDLNETATDVIDKGANDRFVLADGTIIRYHYQLGMWESAAAPDWQYRIQKHLADRTWEDTGIGYDQLGFALDRADTLNADVPDDQRWCYYRVVDADGTVRERTYTPDAQ